MEDKNLEVIDLATTTKQVKLMKLIDPHMCIACDQSKIVVVRKPGEKAKKMFSCRRNDCDNWGEYDPQ